MSSSNYTPTRDCPACEGEGHYPLGQDHPLYTTVPVAMYETPPCDEPGCEYSTGGVYGAPCEACEGIGTISEGVDCEACEGEGVIQCEVCSGGGTRPDHCGQCHEEIEERGYFEVSCYLGDGELYCTSCAFAMYQCETCKGEGRVPHEGVQDRGEFRRTVAGSCSCCGASPRDKDGAAPWPSALGRTMPYDWYVYEARRVDDDGIYMPRLCGDVDGEGCLSEVEAAAPGERDAEKMVAELLGDDTDGAQALIEDYRAIGLID